MKMFTFFLEYRGGTYIHQIEAFELKDSILLWANSLSIKEIKYLGEKSKIEIKKAVKNESLTKINGLKNVWCFCLGISLGFMMVHVVQTEI